MFACLSVSFAGAEEPPSVGKSQNHSHENACQWFDWAPAISLPESLGNAGTFAGLTEEGIVVAGGVRLATSEEEAGKDPSKRFSDTVWLLEAAGNEEFRWKLLGKLPRPRAYGATVPTEEGLLCLGGRGPEGISDTVFLLKYDRGRDALELDHDFPPLPEPCEYLTAAAMGQTVYVAGSKTVDGPMRYFWALGLSDRNKKTSPAWHSLPMVSKSTPSGATLVVQSNGAKNLLYLVGGRSGGGPATEIYRFDPAKVGSDESCWQAMAPMPRAAAGSPVVAWGQSHLLVLGGLDEHRLAQDILAYHTITDTWTTVGCLPHAWTDTTAIAWNGHLILPGGKTGPDLGVSRIWLGTPNSTVCHFGLWDYVALFGYLGLLVVVGFYFTKQKSTSDFFLGGRRIPWWAAGLSLLATQVSSIGFMAIPAKAYATNWAYFAGVATWFLVVPIVTWAYIPFFRRLNVTSAYEYLEIRFHLIIRLLGTVTYSLLQLGRMAIVLYLPALALSVVTGMDQSVCIIIMGVLCTAYTVAGGIEAVIWTDVIQAVLLVGGAIVCVVTVISDIDGGPMRFVEMATADNKFDMVDFNWGLTTATLWVILVGNAFTRLGGLTADQAVVQRYLTTPDEKASCRALWTNMLVSIPWALLVFVFGTALYVFYKINPDLLSPTLSTDGIVPLFVVQKIPAGLSGLIVAAVFAAAMSSLDSSMHSMATIWVTDFYARFKPDSSDATRLRLARVLTLLLGVFGTVTALWMASADVKSLWDSFLAVVGLFIGGLAALFALGIFTRRAHWLGVLIGFLASVAVLYWIIQHTKVNFFLYSAIGFLSCYLVSYLVSLVLPNQTHTERVTIYDTARNDTK